jgi:ribosomal protein S12 methylthiotransferase
MISLGCAKNLVDAEIMLGSVLRRGMEIASRAEDADVLIVNTCAFIDAAKEESIEAILEAHQQRLLGRRANQKLIVSGCMSQRFAREMRELLPEVDAFIGHQSTSLARLLKRLCATVSVARSERHKRDACATDSARAPPIFPITTRRALGAGALGVCKNCRSCNHPCNALSRKCAVNM